MSKEKDKFNDNSVTDIDKLIAELANLPQIEPISSDDISKLISELNVNLLSDLSTAEFELAELLKDIAAADSEFSLAFDDLTHMADVELNQLVDTGNPELESKWTAKEVAVWLLDQLKTKKILYQANAARQIRKQFGSHFTYRNKNSNFAISRDVLKEFLVISFTTVVWNRHKRCWRLRQVGDPHHRRMVES